MGQRGWDTLTILSSKTFSKEYGKTLNYLDVLLVNQDASNKSINI